MNGHFITFEGPEGCGKSTHARRLSERLQALGQQVCRTREPGGTPTGELIRDILQHEQSGEPLAVRTEILLFEASRAQLVEYVIRPALDSGDWVICDRFTDSTIAYQGYGRGFDHDTLSAMNAVATGGLQPDLTLLLDVKPEIGFARLHARNHAQGARADRIERESTAFHARLRAGFLELASREPARIRVIDTDRDADIVALDIWTAVTERFGIDS